LSVIPFFTVFAPVHTIIDKEDDLSGFGNGYLVLVVCLTMSVYRLC